MTWRSPFDPDLPTFDFASLRRAGIDVLQRLSSDIWTDYNLHDPGVTIFEQLIYALTELDYLTSFPVADHLTGPDGAIDFDRLALEAPDEIFPCRPTTTTDLRLSLLDAFPELDDVQVGIDRDAEIGGLYQIDLRGSETMTADEEAMITERVSAAFYRQRNLGEDLACPPCFMRPQLANLSGRITIDPAFDPVAVLADIYLETQASLMATAKVAPFEAIRQQSLTLDDAFSGPKGVAGFYASAPEPAKDNLPDTAQLRAAIQAIPGVRDIETIGLSPIVEPGLSSARVWRLHLPEQSHDIALDLLADGVRFEVDGEAFGRVLNRRMVTGRQDGEPKSSGDAFELPTGRHLAVDGYVPLQEHFPKAYGLGRHRHDIAADPAERARINQLRGYLVHFDQLLSELQSNIAHVRELFSADIDAEQSYYSPTLDPAVIADLPSVYPEHPDRTLAEIRAEVDDFIERKGRILDYLLALYGENPRPWPTGGGIDRTRRWLDARLAMLRQIRTFGRDRGGALDLGAPTADQGGYHQRLKALIGSEARAACDDEINFFVIEHVLLRPRSGSPRESDTFFHNRLSIVFAADQGRNKEPIWRDFVEETVMENTPAHLLADVLWLDRSEAIAFKFAYDAWLQALPSYVHDPSAAEQAAAELSRILMSASSSSAPEAT